MMEAELAQKGAELLVETLKDFPRGQVGWKNRCSDTEQSRAQDSSLVTFARKLTSEDARVLFPDHKALDVQRKHSALAHQVGRFEHTPPCLCQWYELNNSDTSSVSPLVHAAG
jgi:methionyl-tRNA formyltransferase